MLCPWARGPDVAKQRNEINGKHGDGESRRNLEFLIREQ